jgi:hypothetical protein
MSDADWLKGSSPAFRLMIATSWLAPESRQSRQEEAIREAVDAGVNWMDYLHLVGRHRTPALSWAALRRVPGVDAPEPVKRKLQQGSDACHMQAMQQALLLAAVLKGFNEDGIAAMPMKGPILSFELYGDIGLRQSRDLDIMVAAQDVPRGQACLERMGWHPDASNFPMSPRQWEALLRHDRHISYIRARQPCHLELHWCNPWDTEELTARRWVRSTASSWRGCSYQAMNSTDMALYLCSHGSDHAWFRAKWLGDLAAMHAKKLIDWEVALEEARSTSQERSLLLCLRMLREAHGFQVLLPAEDSMGLPAYLRERTIIELRTDAEPEPITALRRLRRRLRSARYDRLLRPKKSWRQSFAGLSYCREDYRVLPLPDRWFWVYVPLRPFLWAWRRLLRGWLVPSSEK